MFIIVGSIIMFFDLLFTSDESMTLYSVMEL